MKTNDLQKNLRDQIVKDYDKIVKFVIKDMNLGYRFDELYDIGIIGFVRGVNSYDEQKNVKYITYLYECIKNEILKHLEYERNTRRKSEVISLNTVIKDSELIDFIPSYEYYDEKLYLEEMLYVVNRRLSFLNERDEKIFKHLYGLDGYKQLECDEIEKKFKTSKQNIQRIKKKILKILKHDLIINFYKTYQDLLSNKDKHFKNYI